MTKAKIMDVLFAIVVAYILVCIAMYFLQRSLMYFPKTVAEMRPQKYALDLQVVQTQTEDGLNLTHWFSAPKEGKPVIVYFHGNAGYIGGRHERIRILQTLGFGVFMAEYRGYGSNPGTPSEDGLLMDAASVMGYLDTEGYSDIIIYGESIGTAIAVQTAANHSVDAVVLEAPFSSAEDVAQSVYKLLPVRLLMKDSFNSIDYIQDIGAPILIMQGTADKTIPPKFGLKLYEAAAEPKVLKRLEGQSHVLSYDEGSLHIMLDFLTQINVYQ